EAAFALAGGIDIPDAQATRPHDIEPLRIRQGHQVLLPEHAQDLPELVLRMAVVLLRTQRGHAREAAQHQQARGNRIENRRQSGQWRHEAPAASASSRGSATRALAAVGAAGSAGAMPRRPAITSPMRGSSAGVLTPCGWPAARCSAVT